VPNGTPAAISTGASCDQCSAALSGLPLVTAMTDATGKFKLNNMPVGADIPVVIQLGKWRRQITVTTSSCADTVVPVNLSRLPRNKGEGNIPKIALSTGGFDTIECLLRKIGIDDAEFTNPSGNGRVNLYKGLPGNGQNAAPGKYDAAFGGQNFPASTTLWGSLSSLQQYDVVLLSCEGDTYPTTKPAAALKAMYDYANNGGRVFASHYHHYWVSQNTNGSGTGAWSTLAKWLYPSPGMLSSTNSLTVPEKIVTTFPKGNLLADWLVTVGASGTKGNLNVFDTKHSIDTFDSSRVLEWIYALNAREYPSLAPIAHAPQYITFNTPVGAQPTNQCGRFIFSDIHVSSGDKGASFPSECKSTTMSAQEKALEFMFFDLASAVCDEAQPPPQCSPLTCADQSIQCGPAPDGCGGTIASCGTCPAGQTCGTGGKCAGSSCTPTTCAALGKNCGSWSDGCGGVLGCGSCNAPLSCGGGGTPGVCGNTTCTPTTCAKLGLSCGQAGDGCGGTLNCGSCPPGETCGGGGVQGQCGSSSCVPTTCAQQGLSCGPAGDGCGNIIQCGTCVAPETCGGGGVQGQCGKPNCTPKTCAQLGFNCGPAGDGCGGLIQCGTCVAPETCGGGGKPGVCGSPDIKLSPARLLLEPPERRDDPTNPGEHRLRSAQPPEQSQRHPGGLLPGEAPSVRTRWGPPGWGRTGQGSSHGSTRRGNWWRPRRSQGSPRA
jgi:hypothetical protein